jgi:hypothetical protein
MMTKTPCVGFYGLGWLRASALGLSLFSFAASVHADETASPAGTASSVEVDPSCQDFIGRYQKVSDIKNTRINTNLFDGLEGKKIRHISFNNMPVFDENDPDENNRLYLSLNKLHINTRPNVVRAQLLFEEGETLNIKQIQESERILRRRPYLTDAYIVPERICANQVDLMVVTKDSWALEPQISVSRESEGTESSFAISDGNILGTGNSLTIGYEENTKRNLISYDFSNPHVFNSQISTRLYYADTSDGRNTIVDISHPFYSLETPWAAGFHTEDVSQNEAIRHMDKEINEFRHQGMNNEVYFGLATDINSSFTQRWLVGITNEEDNFFTTEETLQSIPSNRKAVYPWVEYQFLENRYGVFKNLNQIQRPEDVALGHNLKFRVGYAGTQLDNPDDVLRYIGEYTYIIDFDNQHIVESSVKVDGRHHSKLEGIDSTVWGLALGYHYFQDDKRRWYLGFRYDIGWDLLQYEELTVGDVSGLRGYPTDYQRGNERYVFTVERRYFSDLHIFNLARVGAVVFADVGKAWGIDQYGHSPLLSNVGVGLRLSSSKVRIGNVVHIDFAVPTSARDAEGVGRYQVTVGAQSRF